MYTATYDGSDLSGIVVDFLGTFGVGALAFVSLFVLVIVYKYLTGKKAI